MNDYGPTFYMKGYRGDLFVYDEIWVNEISVPDRGTVVAGSLDIIAAAQQIMEMAA